MGLYMDINICEFCIKESNGGENVIASCHLPGCIKGVHKIYDENKPTINSGDLPYLTTITPPDSKLANMGLYWLPCNHLAFNCLLLNADVVIILPSPFIENKLFLILLILLKLAWVCLICHDYQNLVIICFSVHFYSSDHLIFIQCVHITNSLFLTCLGQ